MEIEEAIAFLRNYNQWRRGADIPQPAPNLIGIALDAVCDYAESKWLSSDNSGEP